MDIAINMKLKSIVTMLLFTLIAYSAYWYYIADNAESYVENIVKEQEGAGVYINYDGFKIEGFPYRLIVSLDRPTISQQKGEITTSWTSDQLIIYAQPWNFTHLIFTSNTSRLSIEKKPSDRAASGLVVDSGSMRLSYNVERNELARLSLELSNANGSNEFNNRPIFSAQNMALHIRSANKDQSTSENEILAPKLADIALGATNLSIADRTGSKTIDELTLISSLRGGEVPTYSQAGLKGWSESGGTLEVSQLKIIVGDFDIIADGSITLDEQLKPLGALSTRLENPQDVGQVVGRFAGLNETARATLLSSLTLLDVFSGQDGVPLSLTAQNGDLWLGPLRLTALPPIL